MKSLPSQRPYVVLGAGLLGAVLVVLTLAAFRNHLSERRNMAKGISNCKQVIWGLRLFASDNSGMYPDAAGEIKFSNQAFRENFIHGYINDEAIFGCPYSPFQPDGLIGTKPDFLKAVEAGENHWAMTKGLADAYSRSIPLVYENPSISIWPPKWNAYEKLVKGRAWKGRLIIVGLNGASVEFYKLAENHGTQVDLAKGEDGKDPFERVLERIDDYIPQVLDIETVSH